MEIAISAGAGVLLGVGLLIWGLRERSARHAAERKADESEKHRQIADDIAKDNVEKVTKLEAELLRQSDQLQVLRKRLLETRNRLIQCQDPKTIKDWLNAELEDEVL